MLELAVLALVMAPTSAASVGRILHFSDVHLNISESLSAADDTHIPIRYFQDAPLPLLESALVHAKEHVVADPELFLYTGDHAAHGILADEYLAKAVETNVHAMENYYPPKRQDGRLEATAIIGNADGNPDYHMEVTDPEKESNPSIKLITEVWKDSLSAANMDQLNRRGYLSYVLDDKLHVITLNTVPYSPSHLPDTSEQLDPFGQFAWLDKTLAELQDAGKFAYIAGHIAPIVDSYGGNPQWHTKYIVKYKNIVGKYAAVIKAQFFGHVHSVEFRVPVTSLDGPSGEDDAFQLLPMYTTGAISPLFGNNPSFMVWDYDSDTYEVLDYTVYASYIAKSEPQLDWKLLFKASEAYGLKSLSLTELSAFVHRAEQNVSLLEDYYWNMKARSPNSRPCKDATCHAKTLCTLKWWTTKGEFLACVDAAQTMLADRVDNNDYTTVSPADAAASSGSSGSVNIFATKDVLMTIGWTALATVVAVACVALAVCVLRRAGILKKHSQYDTIATL
ncbi:Acid sphingomyelinase-like phosphodiesterase 3b [Phytophthora pseudosyringae]|uniref:Acid sphingomyelinase-like phosphodiesterase 3b n=1 Tax=Phytophthora pseudosyringae TaxID=221518 RepID=A0A8T1V5U2_9STRA|nr:Acid sphingomyelinase-like phosphodiesterase 3b [Phytophthora pseudosyringae]